MKHFRNKSLLVFLISALLTVSCTDDDSEVNLDSKVYTLFERSDSGVSGTATFTNQTNGSVLIELELAGTPAGGMHPAHIHFNTAAEGGAIAVDLTDVDGDTGLSSTYVSMTDAGDAITYDELLDFDGYINVHLSDEDLGTIVAQGDIGQNELTGELKTYDLNEKDVTGISGSVLFEERLNGEALATIILLGTTDGGSHPAHIHMNSAAEGGGILFTFQPVDGTTGMSHSNIAMLDDDTMFGYADVLTVDGYVNVHLSTNELGTIVAQGDIGSNE